METGLLNILWRKVIMKLLKYIVFTWIIFASCTTSKDYLSRINEDKALFDAVKALDKNPADSNAVKALPVLYDHAQQRHLKIIEGYKNSKELNRWTQLLDEYSILQKMYDAIAGSNAANRLVTPLNFQRSIYDLKQQAAEEYYIEATVYLAKPGKEDAKKAYGYFKKTDKWVPGYKDAKTKMEEAYQAAIVNVVINEIRKNSFNIYTGWGYYNVDYNNQQFQQMLVRELGGQNKGRYPARYFTDQEIRQDSVPPDLSVDLSLRNLDIPYPRTTNYTHSNSREIEIGRDTSGHIIYQTIYATVTIARQSFTARAEMELNITDNYTRKNIVYYTCREDYSWEEEHGSYSGDSRALSIEDWNMINTRTFNEPRIEDIISELYRRIYPRIKSRISQAVEW